MGNKKKNQITTYDEYWAKAGRQDLFGMVFAIGVVALAGAGLYWFLSAAPYQH